MGARRAMAERGSVTCCCGVAVHATEHAGRSLGACFSRPARLRWEGDAIEMRQSP
jgi:hypothetical protein